MIEAMKQALEALETCMYPQQKQMQAMTALRQAIEQAEKQEPFGYFQYSIRMDAWVQNRDSNKGAAFYTHPQPQREWVGLTDEDIEQEFGFIDELLRDCVYRTEAKLKQKNGYAEEKNT